MSDEIKYELRIEMTPDYIHSPNIKTPYNWKLYRFTYTDDMTNDCICISSGWSKNTYDAYNQALEKIEKIIDSQNRGDTICIL